MMVRQDVRTGWVVAVLTVGLAGCPGGGGSSGDATTGEPATGTSGATTEGGPVATTGGASTETGTTAGSGEPADGTEGEGATTGESTGTPGEPGPDLREAGPHAVELETGTASLPGCSMVYDLRTPAGMADAPVVVLAHGFQGNRASMAGWAEHWASWGLRVVTPNLCHATIVDADHAQNGADLQALVAELALPSPIYAGYSAGGLAAVLAAAGDARTTAVVGLDMVDSEGLGAGAAPQVSVPAFALVGEPSQCNTTNNGLAVFGAMADGHALRVTEADHCDFQSPADFLCGLTCTGSNEQLDDAAIQAAVRGLSAAAVLWQSGLEPTGAQWWTPGEHYYDLLIGLGILEAP